MPHVNRGAHHYTGRTVFSGLTAEEQIQQQIIDDQQAEQRQRATEAAEFEQRRREEEAQQESFKPAWLGRILDHL